VCWKVLSRPTVHRNRIVRIYFASVGHTSIGKVKMNLPHDIQRVFKPYSSNVFQNGINTAS
jgi:hypothetical protein